MRKPDLLSRRLQLYDDQEDAAHPPSVAHPKQEQEQEPEAAIPLPDTNDVLGECLASTHPPATPHAPRSPIPAPSRHVETKYQRSAALSFPGQLGGFSPLQAVPQDGSDEDDDDFNVQLDEPDLDAYEQTRAQALEAKSAAGGGNEDEDDDFNIMLDDPSQSVMGGPDSYSAPHSSKQYVRSALPQPCRQNLLRALFFFCHLFRSVHEVPSAHTVEEVMQHTSTPPADTVCASSPMVLLGR